MITYQTTKNSSPQTTKNSSPQTTKNSSPSSSNHVIIIAVSASVSAVLCTLIVSLLVAYIIKRRSGQGTANRPETEG